MTRDVSQWRRMWFVCLQICKSLPNNLMQQSKLNFTANDRRLHYHVALSCSVVSEWCDLWLMKFNESKTKTMIVSRSRTMHHQSPTLTLDWRFLKVTLGVNFDAKMTFETNLRSVSRAAAQLVSWVVRRACFFIYIYIFFLWS